VKTERPDRVGAVVLAAGQARRFASPKLLMPFGDSTVLGCVVAALEAAGVDPIVVVVAGYAAQIAESLRGTGARLVRNPAPERGMLSSIRVGVASLPPELKGYLIALGDQPRIQPDEICRLLGEHRRSEKGLAVPTYRGKRGHPAVFDRRYREEILALTDEQTLRDLIHSHPDDVLEVECGSDAFVRDIDVREDYEREIRRSRGRQ